MSYTTWTHALSGSSSIDASYCNISNVWYLQHSKMLLSNFSYSLFAMHNFFLPPKFFPWNYATQILLLKFYHKMSTLLAACLDLDRAFVFLELFCNVCQDRLSFFIEVCKMKATYGPLEYKNCVANAKNLMEKCIPCVCEILSNFVEIDCKVWSDKMKIRRTKKNGFQILRIISKL